MPFLKGQKVEVLILVEEDTEETTMDETDYIRQNKELMQQIALSTATNHNKRVTNLQLRNYM